MTITTQQLEQIIGTSKDLVINQIINYLNDDLSKYQVNSYLRISHYLAQVIHESGSFTFKKENLNYSADSLVKVFPGYFTADLASQYAHNPEKIANRIYSNRMGNGNEASGDGYKYFGRGFIQITGKWMYQQITNSLKIDFINHPELLENYDNAVLSSLWFWDSHKLNDLADKDDILTITKKINGGVNGLSDRQIWLDKCKAVIK